MQWLWESEMSHLKAEFIRNVAASVVLGLFSISAAWAGPIFNPGTGNWYNTVSSGGTGAWATAENNAIALGGHLVTINDAAEETWLRSSFSMTIRYWIGYNDAASEGNFVWSSGETPGFTHWNGGEPNNASSGGPNFGEDFAVLNWNTSTGAWNDWDHDRGDYRNIAGIAEWYVGDEPTTPVPEPTTLLLFGLALVGLAYAPKRLR